MCGHACGFVNDFCRVQQSFRRDAADIQAGAAEVLLLDAHPEFVGERPEPVLRRSDPVSSEVHRPALDLGRVHLAADAVARLEDDDRQPGPPPL